MSYLLICSKHIGIGRTADSELIVELSQADLYDFPLFIS